VALGNAIGVAESLEGLAYVGIAAGQGEAAATLLGLAETLRRTAGTPLPPSDRAAYERSLSALREQMDSAALDAAWGAGATLGLEQAVEASGLLKIRNSDEGPPQSP
jgi:hypothetical protein